MMKKRMMTVILVMATVLGSVGVKETGAVKADVDLTGQNYIVQTTSEKATERILDDYTEIQTISLKSENETKDNVVTILLDVNEAKKLQEKSGIVSVERDLLLKGFSDKESNKIYQNWAEDKNMQWNLDMIGAKDVGVSKVNDKIKVAVIDSGERVIIMSS